MQTVILAGGYGSRFFQMTETVPKPMIPIGEVPLILYVMDVYVSQGYREFILCTGYLSSVIEDYFRWFYQGDREDGYGIYRLPELGEIYLRIVDTGLDSSTAKRLELVRPYLNRRFMLTYADGVADVDLSELLRVHEEGGYAVTLTAVLLRDQFGTLEMEGNTVFRFKEKISEHWINGGFMVCDPSIFDYIDSTQMLEIGTLPILANKGLLGAYQHCGFWKCVDNLQNKLELEKHIREMGKDWIK